MQTGNTLSAAAGDAVIATIEGQDSLGIDNPSIDNVQNDLISDGNDSGDFNPGETITLTFDQDVVFTAIELESVEATDSFDVLVGGVAVLETTGDDAFLDDLGGLTDLTITAGSEITFAVGGVVATTSTRIETFTVEIMGGVLKGDVDTNGFVEFADIPPFINLLINMGFQAEADTDCNGVVEFADIPVFINLLIEASSP